MVAEDVAGLSSIIGQINRESVETAEKITAKAKEDAKQIIKKATESANDKIEAAKHKADIVFKTEFEREETSAEHGMSQTILEAKQKLLDKSVASAAEKLKSLDVKEYFNFLQTLITKYAQNKKGELLLSNNDIERMPDVFKNFIAKNYSELNILESENIDGGFVIKYGDIEENCTINALIEENIDSIKEKAYTKLFS